MFRDCREHNESLQNKRRAIEESAKKELEERILKNLEELDYIIVEPLSDVFNKRLKEKDLLIKINNYGIKIKQLVFKMATVCELFWKLVASPFVWVLSNPLWIFAFIWRKWQKKDVDGILHVIPILFNIAFLVLPGEHHWYNGLISGWIALFFFVITVCIVTLISVGIIYSIQTVITKKNI